VRDTMQEQQTDTRLIEAGFHCHQVGAETQRERVVSPSGCRANSGRKEGSYVCYCWEITTILPETTRDL